MDNATHFTLQSQESFPNHPAQFLVRALMYGEMSHGRLLEKAQSQGISEAELQTAASQLGVVKTLRDGGELWFLKGQFSDPLNEFCQVDPESAPLIEARDVTPPPKSQASIIDNATRFPNKSTTLAPGIQVSMVPINYTPLETALMLLGCGYWPVALHPVGSTIQSKDGQRASTGKEPIGNGWGATKPTEQSLRSTFANYPEAGVGIRLGPEGGVIDLECDGPEGEASLVTFLGGEEIVTAGWSSRRGGHQLFQWDDRLAVLGKIKTTLPEFPGLEIRTGFEGKQAQSACPPTLGEDGIPRVWTGCNTIASLPEHAIATLIAAVQKPPHAPQNNGQDDHWKMHASGRPDALERARAYVFAPGFPDSIEGKRGHDRLYHVACVLIDEFGLTRDQALPIFRDWNNEKAIPPEGEYQLEHKLDDALKNHPTPTLKLLNAERSRSESPRLNTLNTLNTPPPHR